MMNIVIKISEEEYDAIKKHPNWYSIGQLIAKGTPLPKGHGDLIDRDALRESMHGACMGVMAGSDDYDAPLKILDSATVIIAADKAVR